VRFRGLIVLFTVVVTSIAFTGAEAGAHAPAPEWKRASASSSHAVTPRFFAASSVWNEPVARDAAVDATSSARVGWLLKYLAAPGGGPWINTYQYSVPVYRVSATQPTVQVKLDAWGPALQSAWQAVPLPAGAMPALGTDASLVVYQRAMNRMWEFWQLSRRPDGIHARWGGAMAHVSTNAGYYSPDAWPTLTDNEGWNWGSSASSLPAVAGLMTTAELRAGHIDHALAVGAPQACTDSFAFPAQRSDGTSANRNCLPEGAHLRLDPSLDLSRLHLPRLALIMARAMQKYGIIVHDTTNSSFSFYAEQPTSGPDPYAGRDGIFDGLQEWQFLPRIPWDRLQLLAMRVCTSSPCHGAAPIPHDRKRRASRHSPLATRSR
jgi:hypothetical protein